MLMLKKMLVLKRRVYPWMFYIRVRTRVLSRISGRKRFASEGGGKTLSAAFIEVWLGRKPASLYYLESVEEDLD